MSETATHLPEASGILRAFFESLAPATQQAYRSDIRQFEALSRKSLAQADPGDVFRYYQLIRDHYKPATVNRKMSAISGVLDRMEAVGIIDKNPVETARKLYPRMTLSVDKSVIVELAPEHIRRTLELCPDPRLALVIQTLAITGMRISELINMRWSRVVVKQMHVEAVITGKGKKDRVVYLPLRLMKSLKTVFHDPVYLFVNSNDKPYNRVSLYIQIKRAFYNATGLEVHPHMLRHFYATQQIDAQKNIKAVSRYLGHASAKTTLDMYVDTKLSAEEAMLDIG